MKIGIMSMQRVLNYGSFMQALGLKTMIESLGHEVVFVDYKVDVNIEENIKDKFKVYTIKSKSKKIVKRALNLVGLKKSIHPAMMGFKESFDKNFHILGIDEKNQYNTKVDVLVIGSDEVFNCFQLSGNIGYSLELFGKNNNANRLISYAASFGNTNKNLIDKYGKREELSHYLNKFDAISIRDKNSFDIVEDLCGKTPNQHLDPVLVSRIEDLDWKSTTEDGYIAVYGYYNRFSEQEGEAIVELAKKKNLRVVNLYAAQKFGEKPVVCRPDELFGYIKNADYVITDTFHGTIFSTILHKQLAIISRGVANQEATNAEKLIDLVKKLKMEDRIVKDLTDLEKILDTPIDYAYADEFRASEREKSMQYLKENLV